MQKKKIAGYMRAKKALDNDPNLGIREAAKIGGISAMTFYKYKKIFGDQITENTIEVLPPERLSPKEETALERILRENAALAEQLKLREELAKYGEH